MMPKRLQAITDKHPDQIEEVWNERADGWWMTLKPGFISIAGTHVLHEETVKELIAAFREVIACNCPDCEARASAL